MLASFQYEILTISILCQLHWGCIPNFRRRE